MMLTWWGKIYCATMCSN